ncbi:metallophosphoesterase family protein [Ferruginibacter yonginensis]|uniref:Metallophosphoesterase family protein n=1 Tax=Ferruginibacter yonginensis TaxID=1310416 RepID=A0ABV8QQU0_9BACT
MTRIGLMSDTHGWLDELVLTHFNECDEIWHAGDFGPNEVDQKIKDHFENTLKKPIVFRGVYGNIDTPLQRQQYPENLFFTCEQVKVFMRHIGGYPGRYAPGVKQLIQQQQPQLFISGHSHILKIMFDDTLQCLHMNPGAAGKQGWHKIRTLIRFTIEGANMKDCEVIELGSR